MSAWNPDFYTLNAQRSYPIDEGATATDDAGLPLPSDLLVDLFIRFPRRLGRYAYLSALSAGPGQASLVLSVTDLPARPAVGSGASSAPLFQPVAAVSVLQPVEAGRSYALEPLVPGVVGWVVFGPGASSRHYSGRFTHVAQSQIMVRCAVSHPGAPIPSIGKPGATPLTGIVQLVSGNDLALSAQTVDTGSTLLSVLGLGIAPDESGRRDLLALYAGPCGGRPQNRTCTVPAIEALNGVKPNCRGEIELEFRAVYVGVFPGGILLDLPAGLAALCPRDWSLASWISYGCHSADSIPALESIAGSITTDTD